MERSSTGIKVQLWSLIFLCIGILASVIGGIAVASEAEEYGFLVFLLVAGGGSFIFYIISLPMRAFGELVEDTRTIADCVVKMRNNTGKSETVATKKESINEGSVTSGYKDFSSKKTNATPKGSWTCTCGRENANYVGTCACGRTK